MRYFNSLTVISWDEMAHLLSRITMNWGKLEQALYLSMRSIDAGQADAWREAFFSVPVLAARKEKARKSIDAIVATSYPKLLTFFDETLDELQDVQRRRNAVNTPPPKGGGFKLRLEAGLIDPSGRFSQTTLKLSSGSSGF